MRNLYRAKKTADYGGDWIISSLIQVYPTGILMGELDKGIDINHLSPDDLNDNVRWYPVAEHTLCMAIEYNADDDSGTPEVPIFDKDIVEFDAHGTKKRYAVWFMEEGSCFRATPWDEEDVENGDAMFINYPINFKYDIKWDNFILMLQDPYNAITSVKVIGNYIDNPEIFEPDDSEAIKSIVDIGTKKEQSNKVFLEF